MVLVLQLNGFSWTTRSGFCRATALHRAYLQRQHLGPRLLPPCGEGPPADRRNQPRELASGGPCTPVPCVCPRVMWR